MLEYDKTDVSKRINVNKTNGLSECIVSHYWYFFLIDFRFQSHVWDACHAYRVFIMLSLFLLKDMNIESNFAYD